MLQDVKLPPTPRTIPVEEVLRVSNEGVILHDDAGKIVYSNPAAERILGVSADRLLGNDIQYFEQVIIREDGSTFPADEHPVMLTLRTGQHFKNVVMGIQWERGPCTWISINSAMIPASCDKPAMAFSIFADVTPHVEAKRQLREMAASLQQTNRALATTEALMRSLLRAIPDHVWLKDPEGVYLFCNSALARTYNTTEAAVIGKTDYDFSEPAQADRFREQDLAAACSDKPMVIEETVSFLANAAQPAFETVKVPMRDETGELVGILGISRDITERRDLQQQLRQSNAELQKLTRELQSLVHTDPLTKLPNRRAFEEAIGRDFRRFKRAGTIGSILLIDIDHFKRVNDSFGHNGGDAALIIIADAFRANCRDVDTAARLGGEEFALLLQGTPAQEAALIGERLRDEVQKIDIAFDAKRFGVTISIGISSFLISDAEWSLAVGRADAALYAAKAAGRNRVCSG